MRRMMLSMSQEKLGDALSLTFQQVQKYEKGTNRIGASRLQQISHILQVPVAFFFEGAPNLHGSTEGMKEAPSPAYVSDFLATSEGLSLTKAFMRIKDAKLRRKTIEAESNFFRHFAITAICGARARVTLSTEARPVPLSMALSARSWPSTWALSTTHSSVVPG